MNSVTITSNRRRVKKNMALLSLGALVFAVFCAVSWIVIRENGPYQSQTVKDLVMSNTEVNPLETTSELCQEVPCLEGWTTDVGSFLRFKSFGEAEYWALVLGNGAIAYEHVVLDIRGLNLTLEDRRAAIDLLFSGRDWF